MDFHRSSILAPVGGDDAEILKEYWEELARRSPMAPGDFSRYAEETWDSEIVYEEDPRWPGSATYRGLEAVTAAFEGYGEVMGRPKLSVERIVDAGDQHVVLVRLAGTSVETGVPWDHVWAYLCRIRNRKLTYLRAYWDPDEALAAAGVDSSP
jgi:ketosteroid isomerase-like protein